MKILETIKLRWSPRAFTNEKLDQASVDLLLEAARWAPSSMNEQPWLYYYSFRGESGFDRMLDCLVPQNSEWAAKASLLILSVAAKNFNYKNRPNRHAMHDTGAANSMLATQASAMGLQVHQMGGFNMAKTIETFELDGDKHEPASFIAVGFEGSPDDLNPELKAREIAPRSRKDLDQISTKF